MTAKATGRPKVKKSARKSSRLTVYLTPAERKALRALAEREGIPEAVLAGQAIRRLLKRGKA